LIAGATNRFKELFSAHGNEVRAPKKVETDVPPNRLVHLGKSVGGIFSGGERVRRIEEATKRIEGATKRIEGATKRIEGAQAAVELVRASIEQEAREAAWRSWRAEHRDEVSGEELSARSLEATGALEGLDKIRQILDQLPLTDQRVRILSDPHQKDRHDPAAMGVLRTLRYSLQVVTSAQSSDPPVVVQNVQPEDLVLLKLLGEKIHSDLIQIGIFWPPPFAEPPPAASRDLMDMYRVSIWRTGSRDQSLHDTLEQLLSRIENLLRDSSSHKRISIARWLTDRDSNGRRRIELIVSSAACVITLMQAPGTVQDFSARTVDLARDVVTAFVVKIASDIGGELSEGGDGDQVLIPPPAPDSIPGLQSDSPTASPQGDSRPTDISDLDSASSDQP
jgi:hypothetical protein